MIKAILFDLDGTLLPMDRSVFESAYMGSLAQMAAGRGYDPKDFLRALGKSIAAMAQNDGSLPNGDVFWNTFAEASGKSRETEEPAFQIYYETDYQKLEAVCGKNPAALLAVKALRQKGYTLAVATNPVFPVIGIESRLACSPPSKTAASPSLTEDISAALPKRSAFFPRNASWWATTFPTICPPNG